MREQPRQYTARYRYDDHETVWLAQIDEIPEVHTFGLSLPKAEAHLREALALWLEVPEDSLRIVCG